MIQFRPITLSDRARIEQYTMPRGLYNCDLSFANIYCWRAFYQTAWAEVEGFLVIRFHIDGGAKRGYMQPVGDGDFTAVIERLKEEAATAQEPLRLIGLTDAAKEALQRDFAGEFIFDDNRATHDYLYRRAELSLLKGKNYQPKRNHINRFVGAYPDYRYEPLTAPRIEECIRLEQEWCRHRNGCIEEGLSAERRAIHEAFAHFEELGLQGGCIYVGEQLVAFTYGSALNNHTFDIHVEKADTRFEGAFTIINRRFAEQLDERFTLLNREEDLGLEGLRKAKLSYYPAFLQPKHRAEQPDTAQRACQRLWERCFPQDEAAFVEQFLVRHFRAERMLTQKVDDRVVAMLHTIPFSTAWGRMRYIYGVATDPDYRHRGLSTRLLDSAIAASRAAGDAGLFLIPADSNLRTFYAKEGFDGDIPVRFTTGDDFDFGTGCEAFDRAMIYWFDAPLTPPEELHADLIHEH